MILELEFGPHACYAGTLLLELPCQSCFVLGISLARRSVWTIQWGPGGRGQILSQYLYSSDTTFFSLLTLVTLVLFLFSKRNQCCLELFFLYFCLCVWYWSLNSGPLPWATPSALFLWWVCSRQGLENYLLQLVSNHDPTDLCLLSS
jgi:hypothetical protein